MGFTFLIYFSISKYLFPQFPQKPNFEIFVKKLFCTLASSTNVILKVVQVEAGNIYIKLSVFLLKTNRFLRLSCIFKEVKTKN